MNLERYSIEMNNILENLNNLKQGNYHERLKKPGIPTAKTIGFRLETDIINLLEKIKDDSLGTQKSIDEAMKKLSFIRE